MAPQRYKKHKPAESDSSTQNAKEKERQFRELYDVCPQISTSDSVSNWIEQSQKESTIARISSRQEERNQPADLTFNLPKELPTPKIVEDPTWDASDPKYNIARSRDMYLSADEEEL